MNTPHKHAALIKAWADGAQIQVRTSFSECWKDAATPNWIVRCDYRIKPIAPQEPDYGAIAKKEWIMAIQGPASCDAKRAWGCVAKTVIKAKAEYDALVKEFNNVV